MALLPRGAFIAILTAVAFIRRHCDTLHITATSAILSSPTVAPGTAIPASTYYLAFSNAAGRIVGAAIRIDLAIRFSAQLADAKVPEAVLNRALRIISTRIAKIGLAVANLARSTVILGGATEDTCPAHADAPVTGERLPALCRACTSAAPLAVVDVLAHLVVFRPAR